MNWYLFLRIVVTIVIPTAVAVTLLIRDARHFDRRTKMYHTITYSIVILLVLCAIFTGWLTWKDVTKVEKKPLYSVFLNDLQVQNNVHIIIPCSNETQTLMIRIKNYGDCAATELTVLFHFPAAITNLPLSVDWHLQTSPMIESNGILNKLTDICLYETKSQSSVFINSGFTCAPLLFHQHIDSPLRLPVLISVRSRESDELRTMLHLEFVPGIGKPYLRKQ